MADQTTFEALDFQPGRHFGVQAIAKFANGYRASVIRSEYSYGGNEGLYELAVMDSGGIVYDTPITDDVLGHLNREDVTAVLMKIAALPAKS